MPLLEPEAIGTVVTRVAGRPREQMMGTLVAGLRELYGDHILDEPDWVFNLIGGGTGAMAVLHASLAEYLVVFGTSLGTEGFSGRYTVDIHDWVLAGEMWGMRIDDPMHRQITRPGEVRRLPEGVATGFRLQPDTWLLEYGRGNVSAQLPHSISDAVFRAMDTKTIVETLRKYGAAAVHELWQKAKS